MNDLRKLRTPDLTLIEDPATRAVLSELFQALVAGTAKIVELPTIPFGELPNRKAAAARSLVYVPDHPDGDCVAVGTPTGWKRIMLEAI